jgi:hypothetical protein
MSCPVNNNSPIRKLYFECQDATLNNYGIEEDKRIVISSVHYLIVSIPPEDYTRIEVGEKTGFVDTFRRPFITPRNIRVGFSANITDNKLNIKRCLEFLAVSSVSTSYSSTYIPVTVLDYVRPEYSDSVFTTRKGLLTVSASNGYSGSGTSTEPLFTEPYEINFQETGKRLIM